MTKLFFLIVTIIVLSGCGNSQKYEDDISDPQLDEATIDLNERYIEGYEKLINQYAKEIEESDNEYLNDMNKDEIEELERMVSGAEDNILIAENTYIYNDEFKTVGNHAVIVDRADAVLTENMAPNLFSNELIEKIRFYDEQDLIEEAVIGTLTTPTQSEEETEVVALSVYLTKETLNKINLEELKDSEQDIFDYAEGVHAHGSLEGNIQTDTSQLSDGQHQVFYMHIGSVIEQSD